MAIRFYLPSTGTPSISPAINAGWEVSTNLDRRIMVTTRISSAMTNKTSVGNSGLANQQILRQYHSAALAAQTLSGTLKGQFRGSTTAVGATCPCVSLSKCNSDGSVVTSIIAPTQAADATTNAPPAFDTTITNRKFETTPADTFLLTVPSTSIDDGDFLLLELGIHENNGNGARTATIVFGDDSGTDLPEDETTTAANNPWAEFSADIIFAGGGGSTASIAWIRA